MQVICDTNDKLDATTIGPQMLSEQPLILPERGVGRTLVDRWMREHGVSPTVAAQVAGNEAIVSMVSLGRGLGVVPQIVLDNSPLADQVRVVNLPAPLGPIEIGLFALESRLQGRLLGTFWQASAGGTLADAES